MHFLIYYTEQAKNFFFHFLLALLASMSDRFSLLAAGDAVKLKSAFTVLFSLHFTNYKFKKVLRLLMLKKCYPKRKFVMSTTASKILCIIPPGNLPCILNIVFYFKVSLFCSFTFAVAMWITGS